MPPLVFVQSVLEVREPKCLMIYDLTVIKGHRTGHGYVLLIVECIRIMYVCVYLKNK